ncbi:MAG: HEAT repeat domain-containing protein [Candidatus Ozemobacteraceae bacterium]
MEKPKSISLLSSAQELERIQGITLLAKTPTEENFTSVRNMAENDESVDVRYFARKALNIIKSQLKPQVSAAKPPSIDLNKVRKYFDGGEEEKLGVLQALIDRHLSQTVPLIYHSLKRETNVTVISAMLKAIGVLGGPEAIRLLLPFLEHANPRIRANAVEALDLTGSSRGYPFIIQRLTDSDNRVRANASAVVRKIPRVNTVTVLRNMLKSTQTSMQASAAFAIQWFAEEENAQLLSQLMSSPDATVRRNVMASLRIFADKGIPKAIALLENIQIGKDALVETSHTLDEQMREVTSACEKLRSGLASTHSEERIKAIRDAIELSGLGIAPLLIEQLKKEKHSKVLATIITAMGRVGAPEAVPYLVQCLRHLNDRCRANAVEALRLIGNTKSFKEIIPLLSDPNNRTRANAILALKDESGVDLLPTLKEMVKSNDLRMQQSALYAIKELNNPAFFDLYHDLAKSKSKDISSRAKEEVQELTKSGRSSTSAAASSGDEMLCPSCREPLMQGLDHWVCIKCFQTIALSKVREPKLDSFPDLDKLPAIIAQPFYEYLNEADPTMKLWRAFDAVEIFLRFLMILGLVDLKKCGTMPVESVDLVTLVKSVESTESAESLKEWRDQIAVASFPKLKKLLEMVYERINTSLSIIPEGPAYVKTRIIPFLDGPTGKKTAETSFNTLRNHLLQGRALPSNVSINLLEIWHPRLQNLISDISWMNEFQLIVSSMGPSMINVPATLRGFNRTPQPLLKSDLQLQDDIKNIFPRGDEVIIMRNRHQLTLWPFLVFCNPSSSDMAGQAAREKSLHIFSRRELKLEYFSSSSEELGMSSSDAALQEAFHVFFGLEKSPDQEREEFFREAWEVVGREEELETIRKILMETREGVLWLTGHAGIGKSALTAKTISQLAEEKNPDLILISYRFKVGDRQHSRDSFLQFALDRLSTSGIEVPGPYQENDLNPQFFSHNPQIPYQSHQTSYQNPQNSFTNPQNPYQLLRASLRKLQGKRVIFVLDGLDELVQTDVRFVGEIPLGMNYQGVTWLCVGRPEKALVEAFSTPLSRAVFPHGVPPMKASDIRAMILEKTGTLRKNLLVKDIGQGDKLMNPFIERVIERSGGFPLYINYVISDLLENRMKFMDAGERLPPSLATYHDDLLSRIIRGGTGKGLSEIASLLAVAREPLGIPAMADFILWKRIAPNEEQALILVREGISELQIILKNAQTADGDEGFALFHSSLRDHMENSSLNRKFISMVRKSLGDMLMYPKFRKSPIGLYLRRWGFQHLLEEKRWGDAEKLLLDIDYLEAKAQSGFLFDLASEFSSTIELMPPQARKKSLLRLLEKAIRADLHFLSRHPHSLFECLWNRGWWYDNPDVKSCYETLAGGKTGESHPGGKAGDPLTGGKTSLSLPWERKGERLYKLLESWKEERGKKHPDALWIKSLRPPPIHLGSGQWAMFQGHEKLVSCIAYSPDGKRIASGGYDQSIRMWDAVNGEQIQILTGHDDYVKAVAFSPDGKKLASGSSDKTVRIWDAESGTELQCLRGHEGSVECVAFSPLANALASGSMDKTIRIWNPESGQHIFTLTGHAGSVTTLAFSKVARQLLSGSEDRMVKVWNSETSLLIHTLKRHEDGVTAVVFHPLGELGISASNDRTIRIWDLVKGTERLCIRGHQSPIEGIDVSPDGTRIVSGSLDKTVRIWSFDKGQEILRLRGHEGFVRCVAFSPDGRKIASGSSDKTVRIWDTESSAESHALYGHDWFVRGVAFSPDGTMIALGSSDKLIHICNSLDGHELFWLKGHEDAVRSVKFFDSGRKIISGSADKTVRIWDVESRVCLRVLTGPTEWVFGVAVSPDGKRVAAGSGDHNIHLWDLEGDSLHPALKDDPLSPTPEPDSLIPAREGDSPIPDSEGASPLSLLEGHQGPVRCVAFSPDGHFLASGSEDAVVRIWNLASGATIHILAKHKGAVNSVAFAPTGNFLVSGSADHTIRIWNMVSGECTETIQGRGAIDAIAGGPGSFPLRAIARKGETVIESAIDGHAIGYFPANPNEKVIDTHPSGKTWIMAEGNHFYLITVDGDISESDQPIKQP